MPEVQLGQVPFDEAITHFRRKLNIPSKHWDDLLGQVHAKAFTVAGATKAELLKDLRGLVDQAIANGTTIADFRRGFDKAVQEHGWSYKGNRAWRTRVIYDTNLRTAHMAGKWTQLQQVKERRPYLQYLTVGDQRVRPQHQAWHGIVLPVDDPWWDTHYPPNGWGCRCTVRSLSQRQLEREDLSVSGSPGVATSERINTRTGEVYGEVPEGIDTGWDYNVGKSWLGPDIAFGETLVSLPPAIRRQALVGAAQLVPELEKSFAPWANQLLTRQRALGEIRTVGYLSPRTVDALLARGQPPATAVITVTDRDVMHAIRDAKDGKHLPLDLVRAMPRQLAEADAVLWDKADPALLYVVDVPGEARAGKFVVRINYKVKLRGPDGRRESVYTNTVRTSGLLDPNNLRDPRYEVLEGEL